ncbi:MAG: IclR family transcriptional regulator [Halalkalicoccus sp.]
MYGTDADRRVKTTDRSLDIIERIRAREGCTLATLVDELGLAKSTVHKHLSTLESRGYLIKEGETYHVGLKFHHHGEHARLRRRGYRLAGLKVQQIAEQTSEEGDFVVENDGRVITIHESYHPSNPYRDDPDSSVDGLSSSGTYYYMHCTAGGKALLAAFPRERVEAIVEKWGLPEQTDRTLTTERALFEDLATVRERGYSVTDQEFVEGLRAIGVAVHDRDGSPLGALSMSIPTYRRDEHDYEGEASRLLLEAAADIEQTLAAEGG